MRRLALLIIAVCPAILSPAQEVLVSTVDEIEDRSADSLRLDTYSASPATVYAPEPFSQTSALPGWAGDTLHLPTLTADGHVMPMARYPFYHYGWGGWNTWDLHEGLNVSLGAAIVAQFGKHARHGAGFGQNISAMYALPVTPRLSLAVGGYMNQLYWGGDVVRDAGVTAVMGYRFDDHWEAFLYGQKSLAGEKRMPMPFYDMGILGDRIGAAVRYNFNPSFSVEVSVEHQSMPWRDSFYDTYMRGVPAVPGGRWR